MLVTPLRRTLLLFVMLSGDLLPQTGLVESCDMKSTENTLAEVNGKPIRCATVLPDFEKSSLRRKVEEYQILKALTEQEIEKALIAEVAAREGLSPIAFMRKKASESEFTISDSELATLISAGVVKSRNDPEAKRFEDRRRSAAMTEFVRTLAKQAKVRRFVVPPLLELEIPMSAPRRGNSNQIRIVEIADFECPACAASSVKLEKLLKGHEGRIEHSFIAVALPMHPNAVATSQIATCMASAGKFWEFRDWVFKNQDRLPELSRSTDLGSIIPIQVDWQAISGCQKKGPSVFGVEWLGSVGIFATPTYLVNNRVYVGELPLDEIEQTLSSTGELETSVDSSRLPHR